MRWWFLSMVVAGPAWAAPVLGPYEAHFDGVEIAEGTNDDPLQAVWVVRVDLSRVDGWQGTPGNGEAEGETTSQTTTEFVAEHGLQLAVNAGFYSPCCAYGDGVAAPRDIRGLVVSDGEVVSPAEAGGGFSPTLFLGTDGTAWMADATPETDLSGVDTAVAGNTWLLQDGVPADPGGERHPRTAVGLSADGGTLFAVVIDGRQDGHSDGATYAETAAWLALAGADDGLNLDGGGSTTLVVATDDGPLVLNTPSTLGQQRSNANHVGLWASPVPVPGDSGDTAGDDTAGDTDFVDGPKPLVDPACGCATGPGGGAAVVWVLSVVAARRRARRSPRGG